MFEFTKFRDLHRQMKIKMETKSIFAIQYNQKSLSCIFVIDESPYCLFLTSLGEHPMVWELKVMPGYKVNEYINDYYALINYLEIENDPNSKFTPAKFFSYINDRIPNFVVVPKYTDVIRTISQKREVEESEKIFFCGWRCNPKNQCVRPENYQKTKIAFGEKIADLSQKKNMSSKWTHIKSEEAINRISEIN